MEDYVGVYLNNEASFAGPFKVYVEDHRLMADFGPGPLSLRKIAPDRFEDARNNEVVFTRNPEGIVSIIHWQIWAGEKVE